MNNMDKDFELKFKSELEKRDLTFKFRPNMNRRVPDFVFEKEKVIVETNDDYSLRNPRFFNDSMNVNEVQKTSLSEAAKNRREYENLGYSVVEFWEYDIKNDVKSCVNQLEKELKANQ